MKIIIADHYGLCFGVRDAIAKARELAEAGPLTILGELAHNPIVQSQLAEVGVQNARLSEPGSARTKRVMVTAHGASNAAQAAWRDAGYTVIDGACPLVRHAHGQLARLVREGFWPVIIGKPGHPEVNGLAGDFPAACIIENVSDLSALPTAAKYGVISQTTQPIDRVNDLVAAIRLARPQSEVRFVDTVCRPTKDRQNALRVLLSQADAIVIVGGRHSNNTRELVTAAKAAGRAAYQIERASELEAGWFRDVEIVGLTAGTSTLKETVAEVAARLEEIAAGRIEVLEGAAQ